MRVNPRIHFAALTLILTLTFTTGICHADPWGVVDTTRGITLGGNLDGSTLYIPEKGIPFVVTSRVWRSTDQYDQSMRILRNTEGLSRQGIFAKLLDSRIVNFPGGGGGRVDLMLESMEHSRSGRRVQNFGDMRNIELLRDLPMDMRQQVADDMLKRLALHEDGHGMNVMWRQVPTNSGCRVDVRSVDPYEANRSADAISDLLGRSPTGNPIADQYLPQAQTLAIKSKLELDSDYVHPFSPGRSTRANSRVGISPSDLVMKGLEKSGAIEELEKIPVVSEATSTLMYGLSVPGRAMQLGADIIDYPLRSFGVRPAGGLLDFSNYLSDQILDQIFTTSGEREQRFLKTIN